MLSYCTLRFAYRGLVECNRQDFMFAQCQRFERELVFVARLKVNGIKRKIKNNQRQNAFSASLLTEIYNLN